ncbi:FHA domain-containing protein DDL, partial [Mucuna pruriens]
MGRHSSGNHSPSSRRHRTHHSVSPPPRDRKEHSGRGSAKPVRTGSGSPDPPTRSRSSSPRTKRLKKAQSERERESDRTHGSNRGRGLEKDANERREKKRTESDDGGGRSNKSDKRTENDDGGGRSNKSSRSRHERSPERDRNGRSRHRSQSPPHQHASAANAKPRDEVSGDIQPSDDENDSIRKMKAAEEALEEKQKQKPSFELSGKLAAETNRVRGVTLLFNEPAEARKPDIKWRLYVFKAGEVLSEPLYIHRQSCYLFGRERRVADIPTDHPSCSKQHAVIQFRQVEKEQPDGTLLKKIRKVPLNLNDIMNFGKRTLLNLEIVGRIG